MSWNTYSSSNSYPIDNARRAPHTGCGFCATQAPCIRVVVTMSLFCPPKDSKNPTIQKNGISTKSLVRLGYSPGQMGSFDPAPPEFGGQQPRRTKVLNE